MIKTKRYINNFVGFTIFTIVIAVLSVVVNIYLPSIAITDVWPFILFTLYIFTVFSFFLRADYINKKISAFANAFMIINFGRLVIFSIIIVIYSYLRHHDAIAFTLTFFVYYLVFTAYEIIAILRFQKSKGEKPELR